MPKIAFSTLACPTWGLEQIVTAGIRHGYDGVEIRQIAGETDLLKVPAFDPSRRAASREFLRRCRSARRARGLRRLRIGLFRAFRLSAKDGSRGAASRSERPTSSWQPNSRRGFVRVFGDVLPAASKRG